MEHRIRIPWQVKLAFTVCLILMLACSESVPTAVPVNQPSPMPEANAPAPETNTDPCDHPDGYVCVQLSDGSWGMLLAAEAANLSGQYVLEYAASAGAGETAIYSASAGSYTVFAVLIPVTLVFNPNLIQQLAEGPPYMYQNGTLSVYQNGQVISVQLVDQSAVQDTVEGDTSVELRDQCQETQQGCMSTPIPKKNIVLIDEPSSWETWESILVFASSSSNYNVTFIATCDGLPDADLYILDDLYQLYSNETEWITCVNLIRTFKPNAKIIVVDAFSGSESANKLGVTWLKRAGDPKVLMDMIITLLTQ